MWKPFIKNQSIAPALQAFRELDIEMFRTHVAQLNDAEQQALQFIKRALEQDSPAHLKIALEMKQPLVEVDRLFQTLVTCQNRQQLLEMLLAYGLDVNQVYTLEGHRSIVRQPLQFPVGLYAARHSELWALVAEKLDFTYTMHLQRSDQFMETHELNLLDLVLLLDIEEELTVRVLDQLCECKATVGLAERLQRPASPLLLKTIEADAYLATFVYAKHYFPFYALIGRQTVLFQSLLNRVMQASIASEMIEDALLAFHNHQPGLALTWGDAYIEQLYEMGLVLRKTGHVDFREMDAEYVLPEYDEVIERLRG
ncbi:hypothetical protein AS033_13435 [Exiguobacterium indicum]|uniref:Uncharacterized protein n=1 Tax=Exiguobacterium indicum TaxID=296995 RepID=A0A0V8GDE3_9BACL|nr:hypothetical protein [Exiguobacterium enclense]KSU48134.1 hypothetical protein AS033_13435 [Exiguobacterium enclense]SDD16659.1 hypothetical protein SAMN05216342_2738 [Exiguobacterium enclense]